MTKYISSENIRATTMLLPCIIFHAISFAMGYASIFVIHILLYRLGKFYTNLLTSVILQQAKTPLICAITREKASL